MGVGQIVVLITIIDMKIYMRIVMIMMDLVAVIMIMMMMMIMKVMMKVIMMMMMMVMIITQSFLVPLPWSACPAENETTVARFRECQVRLRCF